VRNEKRQILVVAEISDHPRSIDDVLSVEGELYMNRFSTPKDLLFDDPNNVRGERGGEDIDCGRFREFGEDRVQHALGRPESSDTVTFYSRKKQFVSSVQVNVFYWLSEGWTRVDNFEKSRRGSSCTIGEELLRRYHYYRVVRMTICA